MPSVQIINPSQIKKIVREVFGYEQLRESQEKALATILAHDKCLLTLPTGAGKSLLYGVTALLGEGLTVVVSPLTALKREQAERFQKVGVRSAFLSFDQSQTDKSDVWDALRAGELDLLFLSPERFVSESFLSRMREVVVHRVFIDEAHCVASWGLNFRPEYLAIGGVLARLRVGRIVALTATAAPMTRKTIERVFNVVPGKMQESLSLPLNENIHLQSMRVKGEAAKLEWLRIRLARLHNQEKVIVYVQRRLDAEKLSMSLKASDIRAVCYHAGLPAQQRVNMEKYIASTPGPLVIFATQAYGMGIDLPSVRTVVVYGFPSGMEEFVQMIGRAGRAGQAAEGVLLWSGSDPIRRQYGLEKSYPRPEGLNRALDVLELHSRPLFPSEAKNTPLSASARFAEAKPFEREMQYAMVGQANGEWSAALVEATLKLSGLVFRLGPAESSVVLEVDRPNFWGLLGDHCGSEDSQRRRVYCALKERADDITAASLGVGDAGSVRPFLLVMSLHELQTTVRLSLTQLEKVIQHFKTVQKVRLCIFHPSEDVLIVSRLDTSLRRHLTKRYEELFRERFAGFEALKKYAQSRNCRLKVITQYFGLATRGKCNQCDFCAKVGAKVLRSAEI